MATRDPVRLQRLAGFFDRLVRGTLGDLRVPDQGLAEYLALRLARVARAEPWYTRACQAMADFERSVLRPEARLFDTLAHEFERYAEALSYMRRVYLCPVDTPRLSSRSSVSWRLPAER